MLLIRQFGGSLQEQVAGLLHDVSHTAFSHVVDVVLENEAEDYHETIFMDVIKQSSIPAILEKYGYEVENILDTSRWSLLEQPAPALCADRIDYTLRDMYFYGNLALEDIRKFLQDLLVFQGKLCVKENHDLHFRNKVRLIDPAVYHQQRLWKASEVSNHVKAMNASAMERFEQSVYVKIIKG